MIKNYEKIGSNNNTKIKKPLDYEKERKKF